jgi:hypothetical protein
MVKPDVDTLPTVPDDPPAAGPDRALDPPPPPPPPNPGLPATPPLPGTACADVVELDLARTTESAITAHTSAAATIHVNFFDSNRRALGQRAGLAMGAEADQSGEDAGGGGGAAPAPAELPATEGPDIALDTGRAGKVPWGLVGS